MAGGSRCSRRASPVSRAPSWPSMSRCAVHYLATAALAHARHLKTGRYWSKPREDKERAYPELVGCRRCQLVVVALETGGRWSQEAVTFVQQLAKARARDAPGYLRRSAELAWTRRWTRLLSTAAASAFAASLVEPPAALAALDVGGGGPPSLTALLEADRR